MGARRRFGSLGHLGGAVASFPLSGAIIDEIFTTAQYFPRAIATELVDTRSTTKYVTSAAGTLSSVAINALPISNAGMLVEPAATNIVLQSQAFNNASWTNGFNTTAADNQIAAPDGTTTAGQITTSGGGGYLADASLTVPATATYSIYVKQGTQGTQVQFGEIAGSFILVTFVFATPSGNYQALGNGWYRIWMNPTATTNQVKIVPGTNTGDNCYIWGVQVESGTSPSSYFATTSAAATRSADSIVIQRTGIGRMVFTFDDNSQQTISGINTAVQYTIPTNLNRPLIKRMTGYAS